MQHSKDREAWSGFGRRVRKARERRAGGDDSFTLRKVAARAGIAPAYLSRIERGEVAPPGEETIRRLAVDLGENADVLLAQAGKVSSDLRRAITRRPQLFAELIRLANDLPDDAVVRLVREVRDGDW
jgi:transcriptional regulator with XRE-family HTH domain